MHFCKFSDWCASTVINSIVRSFHIGTVSTVLAKNDGIFAGIHQKHIFMRYASTDHSGIGFYGYDFRNSRSLENAEICFCHSVIVCLQIFLGCMERISILHGKFAYANQSGTRSCLIAEFGLNLVNRKRIVCICASIFTHQLYCCLFMCHSKYHLGAVTVGESQQFLADAFIASRFFPQRSRQYNREHHFL